MIAHLRGSIISTASNYIILEVNSVGYKVFAPPEILQSPAGSTLSLFIYQKVSDSEISLYGFSDHSTLEFFERLITVSGVGPKIALGIVSAGNINTLSNAISNGDSAFFSKISGVGKKTAERIVVELKDKLAILDTQSENGQIFEALSSLGYSPTEVRGVMGKLDNSLPLEAQIKQALKIIR